MKRCTGFSLHLAAVAPDLSAPGAALDLHLTVVQLQRAGEPLSPPVSLLDEHLAAHLDAAEGAHLAPRTLTVTDAESPHGSLCAERYLLALELSGAASSRAEITLSDTQSGLGADSDEPSWSASRVRDEIVLRGPYGLTVRFAPAHIIVD